MNVLVTGSAGGSRTLKTGEIQGRSECEKSGGLSVRIAPHCLSAREKPVSGPAVP